MSTLPHGAAVVVACSGGADSTALAALVVHARPDLAPVLAYVAHGLRSPEVDRAEGRAVASLAQRLGVPSTVLPIDVVRGHGGPEADARDARYAALRSEAARAAAAAVLVGHHADDQAETVLLRLARGTGIDGLAGMAPVADDLLRPLLDVRRADLHRAAHALLGDLLAVATHDPTNDDEEVRRVRTRRTVIPALRTIGPDPVGALTRLAALARDESEVLDAIVGRLRDELPVLRVGAVVAVPSEALRMLPDALARRLLRGVLAVQSAASALTPDAPSALTVERVLRAADGWRATLPGPLDVSIEHGWHVIVPVGTGPDGSVVLRPSVGRADTVAHAPSGLRITATSDGSGTGLVALPAEGVPPGLHPERFAVRIGLPGPFTVRTRRDGDRVRTSGGSRTLADVMGEARIPRAIRGLLPVVVCAQDVVRWVPGLVVDATVQDTSPDRA